MTALHQLRFLKRRSQYLGIVRKVTGSSGATDATSGAETGESVVMEESHQLKPEAGVVVGCSLLTSIFYAWILLMTSSIGSGVILPSVHWNSSNPIFKASKNDHVIQVSLYDEMDFICPYYEMTTSDYDVVYHEHYVIYQVTKSEYDDCILYSDSSPVMILSCTSPLRRKRFTLLFDPFQSIPNVPEYRAGNTYYYITTSTGLTDGLMNPYHGACLYLNMKLTIHVCCITSSIFSFTGAHSAPVKSLKADKRTISTSTTKSQMSTSSAPPPSHPVIYTPLRHTRRRESSAVAVTPFTYRDRMGDRTFHVLLQEKMEDRDFQGRASSSRQQHQQFLSTMIVIVALTAVL